VITDVVLPKRDGFDLAAEMAALRPQTPVLFLTGYARQDPSMLKALRLSGSDCLFKPFSQQQLLTSVDRALGPEQSASAA
jgi:FixJ family two-component response regulator